jgi:hypothetical protein
LFLISAFYQPPTPGIARLKPSPYLYEDDFYEMEPFFSLDNFLKKAYPYLLYFNYLRKNRPWDNQSLWEILERVSPFFPKGTFNLPPSILDHFLDSFRLLKNHQSGYLVGNAVKNNIFLSPPRNVKT